MFPVVFNAPPFALFKPGICAELQKKRLSSTYCTIAIIIIVELHVVDVQWFSNLRVPNIFQQLKSLLQKSEFTE